MSFVYVVVSVWHGQGRDRTFLHGVFENEWEAEEIALDVEHNQDYVEKEGYPLSEGMETSVYVSKLPFGFRVDDFVPTVL